MTSRTRAVLMTTLGVMVGGIACGGGDDPSGPPASGRKTVLVDNNTFQPVTVMIEPGDTILWSWVANSVDHNIISNGSSFENKGTAVALTTEGTSGIDYFSNPASHQVIFPTAGTFRYYCSLHGVSGTPNTGMQGTVVVN